MNDLLFYALILALLYYFFIYLPQQRQVVPTKPLTQSQSTQTTDPNPIIADNSELEPIFVSRSEWDREWLVQGKVVAIFRQCPAA